MMSGSVVLNSGLPARKMMGIRVRVSRGFNSEVRHMNDP